MQMRKSKRYIIIKSLQIRYASSAVDTNGANRTETLLHHRLIDMWRQCGKI